MPNEKVSREFKVNLVKSVFNKHEFDSLISSCNPYDLSEVQEFLWEALLYVGRDEQGQPIKRDAITSKMEPTVDYWRAQLCGEPVDTCRGRSCFVSHPVCAAKKLRGQIEVIRQCFERRKQRSEQREDALLMLVLYHVNDHHYAAGGIYDHNKNPLTTVGSRVLDGETLAKVVNGMNWAMTNAPKLDVFEGDLLVGDARLIVHSRRVVFDGREIYITLTTPDMEDAEILNKVFKRLEAGTIRIFRREQQFE